MFLVLHPVFFQLIGIAGVPSHVDDCDSHIFNSKTVFLQQNFSNKVKDTLTSLSVLKTLSKVFQNRFLISFRKFELNSLLLHGLLKHEFYGDLMYKYKKYSGKNDFRNNLKR